MQKGKAALVHSSEVVQRVEPVSSGPPSLELSADDSVSSSTSPVVVDELEPVPVLLVVASLVSTPIDVASIAVSVVEVEVALSLSSPNMLGPPTQLSPSAVGTESAPH